MDLFVPIFVFAACLAVAAILNGEDSNSSSVIEIYPIITFWVSL